jgi:hypothetical protein
VIHGDHRPKYKVKFVDDSSAIVLNSISKEHVITQAKDLEEGKNLDYEIVVQPFQPEKESYDFEEIDNGFSL